MKFKVGDVVELLAPQTEDEKMNFRCGWTSLMEDCVGVVELTNDNFYYDNTKFKFKNGDYTWTWDEKYVRLVDNEYKGMSALELVKLLEEYENQIGKAEENIQKVLRELNERYSN